MTSSLMFFNSTVILTLSPYSIILSPPASTVELEMMMLLIPSVKNGNVFTLRNPLAS